jgi:hypothetical protein
LARMAEVQSGRQERGASKMVSGAELAPLSSAIIMKDHELVTCEGRRDGGGPARVPRRCRASERHAPGACTWCLCFFVFPLALPRHGGCHPQVAVELSPAVSVRSYSLPRRTRLPEVRRCGTPRAALRLINLCAVFAGTSWPCCFRYCDRSMHVSGTSNVEHRVARENPRTDAPADRRSNC